MLADHDFCRALGQSLGTRCHLVVVRFTNAEMIRRTTSIPTAGLAAQRFESAVFAATTSWFQRALLAETYAALLFFELPTDLGSSLSRSLSAYAFEDPWSGAGLVELEGDMAAVPLLNIPSIHDAFRAGVVMVDPGQSDAAEPLWQSWCAEQ